VTAREMERRLMVIAGRPLTAESRAEYQRLHGLWLQVRAQLSFDGGET
jgi:hypothetical protein